MGAVVKSTARTYLSKQGPDVAFSTAKDFYQFALDKFGQILSLMKSEASIKPVDNMTDNALQDDSSDEQNDVIHSARY